MDTEKCTALLKALETGNLSGAADELGYTPSGMSRMMASIEQELGLPLLVRGKWGVRATPECQELLPALAAASEAGRALDEAASRIKGAEVGTVRVGTAYPQLYGTLARAIADFGQEKPGVHVELFLDNSTPLATRLASREVDMCVISKRDIACQWTPLLEDELVALVPADHALAKRRTVPLEAFATEGFVEMYPGSESDNSRLLAAASIAPQVRFTAPDTGAACELVAAGLGITMTNRIHAPASDSRVVVKPLDPPALVKVGVALPNVAFLPPAVESFASFAVPRLQEDAHVK